MEVSSRISAIKMRMQEIQSKFGTSPIQNLSMANPVVTPAGLQVGGMDPSGVTFEKLLSDKMKIAQEEAKSVSEISVAQAAEGSGKAGSLAAGSNDFNEIIRDASQKYGVDEKFIKSIIQQESGFNPKATSWCGAMGMMQLMPETAKDLGVKNAYDPRDNIMGGVKYIKEQLDRFGGDKRKALAAYNAGPGAVMKFGGIPPYKETENYVRNIMATYESMGGT
jgi:soluble lytic murein transglycosylase-like protein